MVLGGQKYKTVLIALAAASVLSVCASFLIGYFPISLDEFWQVVTGQGAASTQAVVLLNIRLPRIAAAFLIGAALSVSGSAYQGMFHNPLVSPDILGVASGAGLGASLGIFLHLPSYAVQIMAFGAGLAIALLSYGVSRRVRYGQTVSLVLAGTMFGALCLAGTTMLKYLADSADTLPSITFWLMGSLAKVTPQGLVFSGIPMLAGFVMLFLIRWRLNVLTLGDEEALSVGIHPRRTRLFAIVAATLLSAAAVCLGGLIGWVGLMIPHIARRLAGPQYARMLPVSILLGGCFLLLMDDLARSISVMEIPLGVLTAVVGAPFFLLLIVRGGKTDA